MIDELFLKVYMFKDFNYRSILFYEMLNMRDLERNNIEIDDGCDFDLLWKFIRSFFELEYVDGEVNSELGIKSVFFLVLRKVLLVMEIVCVDCLISGFLRKFNVNIVLDLIYFEYEC